MRGFIGWGSGPGRGAQTAGVEEFRHGPARQLKAICFCQGTKLRTPGKEWSMNWREGSGWRGVINQTLWRLSEDLRWNASKAARRIKFKEELLALFSFLLWTGGVATLGTPHGGGGQFDKRPYTSTLTCKWYLWLLFFLICINVCTYLICIMFFWLMISLDFVLGRNETLKFRSVINVIRTVRTSWFIGY